MVKFTLCAVLLTVIALLIYRTWYLLSIKKRMKVADSQMEEAPMTGSFVRHGMTFSDDKVVVPEEARSSAYYKRLFRIAISQ